MLKWICLSWMVFAMVAGAQPTINTNGIVNAASYAPVGLPNSSVAQGSIVAIFGTAMGPVGGVVVSAWPLQKSLGGVTVQIQDASGAQLLAIPLSVAPTQINAILPSATAVGTATATVTYAGQTSAPVSFTVVQSSFSSFALSEAGSGPGAVQNYVANSSAWPTDTIISAAQPGQAVILYGTGLGPVTGDETKPPVPADLRSGLAPMTLWVGGQQTPIAYAGRSTSAGEDQINFNVPASITGCYVPVMLQIGNVVSNTVTISVAPSGGVCQDSFLPNLNAAGMEANGLSEGTLFLQQLTVHTPPNSDGTKQSITASFQRYAWPYPILLSGPYVDVHGACTVVATGAPIPSTLLDAGSPVTMVDPGGDTTTLIQPKADPVGYYAGGSQNALTAGVYTVKNGSGGKDVGSFSATLTLPAPIVLTNLNNLNNSLLANPLPITWTGGSGDVYIYGSSSTVVNRTAVAAEFICLARAADEGFTVPTYVLAALPPTAYAGLGGIEIDNYAVTTTFTANGLDLGLFQADYATQETLNLF